MDTGIFLSYLYLLALTPLHHCNGEVVYVTPTLPPNPDCPDGLPCHTLEHYFSNSSFTEQTANLSMVFLTGQHGGVCKQTELKSFSFSASGVGHEVAINCTTIVFSNAVAIYFTNLTLDHWYTVSPCSSVLILEMSSVILQNQTCVYIEHASSVSGNWVKFVNTVFDNSSISGILSFFKNAGAMFLAKSTVNIGKYSNVTFVNNQIHPSIYLNYSTLNVESNVHITFTKNLRCALMMKFSSLNIMKDTNVIFINNSNIRDEGIAINVERSTMSTEGDLFFINNSGGRETVCIQTSNFTIRNSALLQFINNSAKGQAGGMLAYDTIVNVEDNARLTFTNNTGSKIGAMAVAKSTLYVRNNASITFIKNSVRTESGALAAIDSNIHFEDNAHSIFIKNSAETFAGAMALWSSTLTMKNNSSITFVDNSATVNGGAMVVAGTDGLFITGLHLSHNATMIFINNSVVGVGGALFIYSSRFVLANASRIIIKFIGNSAKSGGALVLLSSSLEFVGGKSNITFENNSAKENGGAILVQPDLLYYTIPYLNLVDTHCLYKTNSTTNNSVNQFFFVNNSAEISGNDIYGASLAWCNVRSIHNIPSYSNPLSSISGDPLRVCICDNENNPLCQNLSHNHITHSFIPGEMITLPLVVVGGDLGTTPGVVHAYPSSSAKILPSQYHQWITKAQCTPKNYTVYSSQSVKLMLSVHSYYKDSSNLCDYTLDDLSEKACKFCSPLYVNLTVLPCPPGFSLQGDPQTPGPGCDCYPVLTSNGVECNIINGIATLSWNTSLWISTSNTKISLSKHCAFDYCKDTKNIKQLSDDQCDFHRTGRLCGSCMENYSLAIGSSHCIHCSNDYNLALVIFFAAAGFLVVLFISAFNLTVTEGKMNGLIFYANVVWTYKSILFPNQIPSELVFFKTFIAWLNLDFGIETCFVNNLNAFWKSWLQFIFPFYLWSIAGLMVVLARYSTRLTTVFGNRAVPVLATLILLSYMKLLRTAAEILHFSVLTVYGSSPNVTSTMTLVWSVDGTLDYFGYPHILLFVAAMFTLLFLWLPYTLLLLLIQWIRRISHYRLLTWTTRLNPFYDANFAPLKHKHQYWFGVLLLARGIILVAFATNFSIPNDINLLILCIFVGVLHFYMFAMSVYKSHVLLVFQSSFFLNLCFLSGFIIFSHTKSKVTSSMQTSAAVLSIGVVFLQFCCIIVYQIYTMSCKERKTQKNVELNEEQSHAILDISSRHKDNLKKYSAEKQPLMDPNQSDSDDAGQNQLSY